MMTGNDLGDFLVVCVIVGAILYILPRLPLDATIVLIVRIVVIVVFAIYAIRLLLPMAGLS